MIVATAGHIDHGKTLLVKALTGVNADRLPEEKRRGMTIDLGFAYLPEETGTIGFVDVPGHERFIRNMVCGVAGIDCALLVVAADDGPMPQTVEHMAILHLLGIGAGVVALTKIDRVEPERVQTVRQQLKSLLAGTALEHAPVYSVSALTGEGVAELARELRRLATVLPPRAVGGNFRLAVDRAFNVAGAGLVITGTVFSGTVAVGDTVRTLLGGAEARVRGLHAQNARAQHGRAGQRCALNLMGAGLKPADIHRGEWIVAGNLPVPTRKLDARLRVLAGETGPLRHWTPVHVHLGAAETTGRVAVLEEGAIRPGADALVQLVLTRPLGAVHGDRVIVRDQSARRTLGGGRVIDVSAPRRGRARPERLAMLHAMESADPAQALAQGLALAERSGPTGIDLAQFGACRNLRPEELQSLCKRLGVRSVSVGDHRLGFRGSHWVGLRERALRAVGAWHRREPASPGLSVEWLLDGDAQRVAAAIAKELVEEARLVRVGTRLRLPAHRPQFAAAEEALWQRVAAVLEAEDARPPTVVELAQRVGATQQVVLTVLNRAARRDLVARVSETRFFLPRTLSRLAAVAQALGVQNPQGRFTAAQFRDASGLGRNLSIDVLDYFDRTRFTRRIGDARIVLKRATPAR